MANHHELSNFIWQIADLLRGPYRPPQYERVMLPMTVLRRFDCVLAPTKEKVLREHAKRKGGKLNDDALDKFLNRAAGQRFHNHSPLTFEKLKGDPDHIDKHLTSYINGFSSNVRRIFDYFGFSNEIEKMREANVLFLVVSKFCDADLHPDNLDNIEMGLLFENLIRRFNELANETAGDHFTPREVIRLMVNLLFINDDKLLATPGTVRTMLDPACGTGGMLAEAQNYLREHHREAKLLAYGQDYNKRAFAVAASDMLIKQVDHNGTGENIRFGDTFTDDQFPGETFDYLIANPPFGVDWKKQAKEIQSEHEKRGFSGRFGAGLPRINDGSQLFLQHMVSKFEPVQPEQHKHGSRQRRLTEAREVSFLPMEAISEDGKLDVSQTRSRPAVENGYTQFFDGDVIVAKITPCFENGKGALVSGLVNGIGFGTTELHVLNPGADIDPRFLYCVTKSIPFRQQGEAAMTGAAGQKRVPEEFVRDYPVPVFALEKQRSIADFLDRETARLDAQVAEKERWLELVAEKRQALIAHAVTRGLNPTAPLRDSGHPWLGDIPEHWEVWKIAHLAEIGNGSTPARDCTGYWFEASIPWWNSSVVNQDEATNVEQFVTQLALRECHLPLVSPGSLLVAITGQGKTRGSVVVLSFQATINQHLAYVTPDSMRADIWYLRWLLLAAYEFLRVISDDAGGTKGALTCEELGEMRIPLPPLGEQRAIVAHISAQAAKMDALRTATERTIDLLKERRAALIAAAVTENLPTDLVSSIK